MRLFVKSGISRFAGCAISLVPAAVRPLTNRTIGSARRLGRARPGEPVRAPQADAQGWAPGRPVCARDVSAGMRRAGRPQLVCLQPKRTDKRFIFMLRFRAFGCILTLRVGTFSAETFSSPPRSTRLPSLAGAAA